MAVGPEQLREELFRLLDVLEAEGIPYFMTGALVRNLLATARTSDDFDVVLDMRDVSIEDVRRAFEEAGYRVEGPTKGNLGTRLILDLPDYEADLWLAPDTEVHRGEFERHATIEFHGRRVPLLAPEDFVLRKLVNYGQARRGNAKDADDAYQVLLACWDGIDEQRLIERASGYRVDGIARDLVDLVREDLEALDTA